MTTRALIAAAIALVVPCVSAQPDTASPETFTIATWNVQQFVDTHDSPYSERDQDFEKSPLQLEAIADVIREVNADVFAFQEIEGSDLLRAFVEEHLPDMGYTSIVSAPDDTWHQNVAIMSRFPLGVMTSMTAVATPVPHFEEGESNLINDRILAIEVYPRPGHMVLAVTVHLKAGGGDNNAAWRAGQIEYLAGWLDEQLLIDPELNVCILGDFNCTPESSEIQLLTSAAKPYHNVRGDSGLGLTHRSGRAIDHILVNSNLWPELVSASPRVHLEIGPEGDECSNHYPVSAVFVTEDR